MLVYKHGYHGNHQLFYHLSMELLSVNELLPVNELSNCLSMLHAEESNKLVSEGLLRLGRV